jgi:Leucine rich repeat
MEEVRVEDCVRLKGIGVWDGLRALHCSGLPKLASVAFGHNLHVLHIHQCPSVAEGLKVSLVCAPWPHLRELSIVGVPLGALPSDGLRSPRLEVLELRRVGLSLLPWEWVSSCSATLRELDLRSNAISAVPPFVYDLGPLESLSLSDNPIETLSRSVARLTRLRVLRLENCALQGLPVDALCDMTTLSELDVMGNPLRDFRSDSFGASVEFQAKGLTSADALAKVCDPRGAIAGLFDPHTHVRHTSSGPPAAVRDEL